MKFLIIIVIALIIYQQWGNSNVAKASAELNQKHDSDVIMYSAAWCGYCKKARALLNSKGIKFKEFDIEKSSEANAEMKSLGGRGVPVFLIKGEIIKGYDKNRVLQLTQGI